MAGCGVSRLTLSAVVRGGNRANAWPRKHRRPAGRHVTFWSFGGDSHVTLGAWRGFVT